MGVCYSAPAGSRKLMFLSTQALERRGFGQTNGERVSLGNPSPITWGRGFSLKPLSSLGGR